jgi:alkylation response protein AidB-like acyl-CoA dehydrogenase
MIFAMHQIQVACIVHHALGSEWFRDYVREMVARQYLLASATTELGIGGDARSSICAVKVEGGRFTLDKQAPVISYGAEADAILVTCRRSEEAARSAVRAEARKTPGATPISATRLAEADIVLDTMRATVHGVRDEYARMLLDHDPEAFAGFGFVIRVNNLKLTASHLVVDVVARAMVICGIAGYRNDSKLTLGRHLRDAIGAGLMVNNDRILGQNATMQVALREG